MNTADDRITVVVNPKRRKEILELVEDGEYKSISEFVTMAIDYYLDRNIREREIESILLKLFQKYNIDFQGVES